MGEHQITAEGFSPTRLTTTANWLPCAPTGRWTAPPRPRGRSRRRADA
ncbi:hypothetical protein I553_5485 [Mycobacterium xenopi 4042]|uniref:Uncharacterized protein n=1 Tax=Mycobacterium xenopi 4042 TaxID=1299334 RepID=X7ZWC4_MYCXE|nr:hypothetical protein I553_5485 [Mycobacterium xenopi 4042]